MILRRNFRLLPEKPAAMRLADPRIGVSPVVQSDIRMKTEFNPYDLRYSCVRQEVMASEFIRSSMWTDSRSGEIISCAITIPINVMLNIHTEMLMTIGDAAPELKTVRHTVPLLYDGLHAKVTREVGKCLGLDDNYAASSCIPADSLRSVPFTSEYGLSGSVMDMMKLVGGIHINEKRDGDPFPSYQVVDKDV